LAKDVGVGGADRCGPRFTSERLDSRQRGIVSGTSDRRSQKSDGFQRSIRWIRGIELRRTGGIGVHRISTHNCHGVKSLVPAEEAKSRYWGQGQQITASFTPGLFLNSSQLEISPNSWRLGALAGVAAKSWTRTR